MTKIISPGEGLGSGYYDDSEPAPEEQDRLITMAQRAIGASISAISSLKRLNDRPFTVMDVGCGPSLELASYFAKTGNVSYLACDTNRLFVERQREAGNEASYGSALDIPASGVDPEKLVVHQRFVYGWLNQPQREAALASALQTADQVVVIDYDWSVVDGPKEFKELVSIVTDKMQSVGFEPNYGQVMADQLSKTVSGLTKDGSDDLDLVTSSRSGLFDAGVTLGVAMTDIEQTAASVREMLIKFGDTKTAEDIARRLDAIKQLDQTTEVRLPDIVTVCIQTERDNLDQDRIDWYKSIKQASVTKMLPKERSDQLLAAADADKGLANRIIIANQQQKTQARSLQGYAYLMNGLVENAGVNQDGSLISEIDQRQYIERSDYILVINSENLPTTVVKMVHPINQDPTSLPTYQLMKTDKRFSEFDEWFKSQVGDSRTLEVSGLAKNVLAGDVESVVDAILGLAVLANKADYQKSFMGLSADHVLLIRQMLGDEVVRLHPNRDLTVSPKAEHVATGVQLVPIIIDVDEFYTKVRHHAAGRKDNGSMYGQIIKRIDQITKLAI